MPIVLYAKKPRYHPWLLQCCLTGLSPSAVKAAVVCEPCVVEAAAIERRSMVSFEERTIVFEVETIPVVAVPGRIVVVCVSGEIVIVDGDGRRCIDGGRSVDRCRGNIGAAIDGRTVEIRPVIGRESNSYAANSCMAKTGADIYL